MKKESAFKDPYENKENYYNGYQYDENAAHNNYYNYWKIKLNETFFF